MSLGPVSVGGGRGGGSWLLLPLLSFWSHFMGCIDVCLEKRRRNSRVKQVLRICISV